MTPRLTAAVGRPPDATPCTMRTTRSRPALAGCLALLLLLPHCGAPPTGAEMLEASGGTIEGTFGLAGPCWVDDVVVRDFGRVVFVGSMDLGAEVWRIAHKKHLPYRHDGTVFKNREHRLPDRPGAYYHEYVHPTPGIHGPGPQRLVVGSNGDVSYTGDHYATFVALDPACAIQSGLVAPDAAADSETGADGTADGGVIDG